MSDKNLKGNILEATIKAFQKKGLRVPMDDLASLLGISKKTIYTVFPDKNSLVLEMVPYCFSSIRKKVNKTLFKVWILDTSPFSREIKAKFW